jgi:hypothetical protein
MAVETRRHVAKNQAVVVWVLQRRLLDASILVSEMSETQDREPREK